MMKEYRHLKLLVIAQGIVLFGGIVFFASLLLSALVFYYFS